jgi:hypothetical protein
MHGSVRICGAPLEHVECARELDRLSVSTIRTLDQLVMVEVDLSEVLERDSGELRRESRARGVGTSNDEECQR